MVDDKTENKVLNISEVDKRSEDDINQIDLKHNKEKDTNTDDRDQYDWKSNYPPECKKNMFFEACYLSSLFIIGLILYILNQVDVLPSLIDLDSKSIPKFVNLVFCVSGGLLGGTTFGLKYFYRVIARGYWHEDRRYWRFFTPWISVSVALAMSAIFNSKIEIVNTSMFFLTGYLSGYFSDHAVSKMYEVASALFSYPSKE